MRDRLQPSSDAYDFHRSLRLRANRFLVRGESMEAIIESIAAIVKAAEQNSVRTGLSVLTEWRRKNPGEIIEFPSAILESPTGSFRVNFTPDFGMLSRGKRTAVHIWNTKRPDFNRRLAYAAMSLFPPVYAGMPGAPEDLAILSLRDGELYQLSSAVDHSRLGAAILASIDALTQSVSEELGLPTQRRDRPSAPPPAPL